LRAETDKTNARILNVRGDYTYKRRKKGYIEVKRLENSSNPLLAVENDKK